MTRYDKSYKIMNHVEVINLQDCIGITVSPTATCITSVVRGPKWWLFQFSFCAIRKGPGCNGMVPAIVPMKAKGHVPRNVRQIKTGGRWFQKKLVIWCRLTSCDGVQSDMPQVNGCSTSSVTTKTEDLRGFACQNNLRNSQEHANS